MQNNNINSQTETNHMVDDDRDFITLIVANPIEWLRQAFASVGNTQLQTS
jgi:hypothetical protein